MDDGNSTFRVVEDFITHKLGLTKLYPHIPLFLSSFLLFLILHEIIAPLLSSRHFPQSYGKMNIRGKTNWCMHICSQVHCLAVLPLAWACLDLKALDQDRAFGWDERSGSLQAISCGYFLYDTVYSIVDFWDIGFVLHGLSCFLIYLLAYKPFLAYYAARCLLWESSTIFLNIHWFLDKTGKTGSVFQLVNGVLLVLVFFCSRLVYGGMVSYDFFQTLRKVQDQIPFMYLVVYGGGNIVLQTLNYVWFGRMIAALRKRFNPRQEPKANGLENGTQKLPSGKVQGA